MLTMHSVCTSIWHQAVTVILLSAVLGSIGGHAQQATTLVTTAGNVNGTATDGVRRFMGIPFAKPPVGDLRFKRPAKPDPWTGVRMANDPPNSCWQSIDDAFGQFHGVKMWNPNTPLSEDCLYLNVWIPDTRTAKKVIMVWIFGGGFFSGTSTLDVYDPTKLVALKDVIVVSMNYRLGAFGFLYNGEPDAPGNVGVLDQVMALQWVKDNAANMGGDPNKITLFGESAGAASVGYHLLSPLSKDLFTYAIMMSSSPLAEWGLRTRDKSKQRFELLAENCGCKSRTVKEKTKCLRGIEPSKLAMQQWTVTSDVYIDVPFSLVIDDYFLHGDSNDIMAGNTAKETSVMLGVVKDEGIYWLIYGFKDVFKLKDTNPVTDAQFVKVMNAVLSQQQLNQPDNAENMTKLIYQNLYPPLHRPSNLDVLDDLSGDMLFKCSVRNFAASYSGLKNSKVYEYSFNYRLSNNPWPNYFGVPHGYEIEAFFGLPFLKPANYSDEDRAVSTTAMDYITNFAKTGDPNTGPNAMSVQWPAFLQSEEKYLVIDKTPTEEDGLRYKECGFLEEGLAILEGRVEAVNANSGVSPSIVPAMAVLILLCVVLILSGSILPC